MNPIRIFSAHNDWRDFDRLRLALQGQADLEMLGWAEDETTLLAEVKKHLPGVLLLEMGFQTSDRNQLIQTIRDSSPLTQVLMVSDHYVQEDEILAAVEGARGFISKPFTPETLRKAVRATWGGEIWMRRATVSKILKNLMGPDRAAPGNFPPFH